MSVRTGESKVLRAAATYAANDTYYACTNTITSFFGGDRIRLQVSNAVADAGNVTFKAEILQGDKTTYAQIGGDLITVAFAAGETREIVLPVSFTGNDTVRVAFKCSAGATSATLAISGLFYEAGLETLDVVTQRTSVSDGTLTLTVNDSSRQVVTGGASNYVVLLPDARTIAFGSEFQITNASTEVVIVKNYGTASSAFELLLPGDTLTCMCTSVATAAGTWAVTRDMNPNVLDSDPDFFSCGTIAESPQWDFGNLTMGVGSAHTMATDSLATGVVGDAYLSIGTGASGGFVARGNKGYASAATNCLAPLNRGKAFMLRQNWSVSVVPDGTDTYTARFGLHDSDAVASAPANGAYFKLGAAGQVTPECITATTPTTGTAGTAIATPSSTPKRTDLVIVGKSDGTRVDFWRDATHAGSITTVPKTAKMYAGFHIARTGGSTQRIFSISRMQFRAVR